VWQGQEADQHLDSWTAEAVGITVVRREVDILSAWNDGDAVHPLAVHFCSEACKDKYIAELIGKKQAS